MMSSGRKLRWRPREILPRRLGDWKHTRRPATASSPRAADASPMMPVSKTEAPPTFGCTTAWTEAYTFWSMTSFSMVRASFKPFGLRTSLEKSSTSTKFSHMSVSTEVFLFAMIAVSSTSVMVSGSAIIPSWTEPGSTKNVCTEAPNFLPFNSDWGNSCLEARTYGMLSRMAVASKSSFLRLVKVLGAIAMIKLLVVMAGLHLLFLCTETAALLLSPPGRSLTLVMAGRWA